MNIRNAKKIVFNKLINLMQFKMSCSKSNMAHNKFEHMRQFEMHETLLRNCWIVIRIDGKGFHKFADVHKFEKPNDSRALNLMNRCALSVMNEFNDIVMAYGQSDEYSFIMKRDSEVYNRRAHKLISTISSLFASSYVFFWSRYFNGAKLLYPPSFDGRSVLYPSDKNLTEYLCWRQADVHINNLYNTTFWNLVLKANMTTVEAEKFLSGTLSADKNEILFSKFNINYNNEPIMFRKGTTLLRKNILDPVTHKKKKVIVDVCEDMIQNKFWEKHSEILNGGKPPLNDVIGDISELVNEQLENKRFQMKDITKVENTILHLIK